MEVGSRDVQGLPLLAKPAPRQSYSFMAGKPAPSNLKPPGHAKGTSELTTKLGEKGLMAGRSLSPILQSRGHSLFFKRNKRCAGTIKLSENAQYKLGVFSESKSASADQREEGAWGWMIP